MAQFIDAHRAAYGVEPICAVLPIAPAAYPRSQGPTRPTRRVWTEHHGVYGSPRVWRQLKQEGFAVARCTVERLMRELNLKGAARGRRFKTTIPDNAADRPQDLVKRIVGWRITQTLRTDLLLDALEQTLYDRPPRSAPGPAHQSDHGVQYLSIRYTERLADAGIGPSVGSRGDSYDNALDESVIGLYKNEVINRRGAWRSVEAATLEWVDWFNHRRLLAPFGYVPPVECEEHYYSQSGGSSHGGRSHVIRSLENPVRLKDRAVESGVFDHFGSHFSRVALSVAVWIDGLVQSSPGLDRGGADLGAVGGVFRCH